MATVTKKRVQSNGRANAEKRTSIKEDYSKRPGYDKGEVEYNDEKVMIERIPLEGTPFQMIRKDNECMGCWGENRVTPIFRTIPEVEDALLSLNWWAIIQVAGVVAEKIIERKLKERSVESKGRKQLELEEEADKLANLDRDWETSGS